MNNTAYNSGTLLQTRKNMLGIDCYNKKPITIPRETILILLEYANSFYEEHVKVLYNDKVLFITDVDFGHDFKTIYSDDNIS